MEPRDALVLRWREACAKVELVMLALEQCGPDEDTREALLEALREHRAFAGALQGGLERGANS